MIIKRHQGKTFTGKNADEIVLTWKYVEWA